MKSAILNKVPDATYQPRYSVAQHKTVVALLIAVCIWIALVALTWAHWGNLTIDCGREMYLPAELAKGKTLYTDLWYPYTPGAPYVNSILFRLFGARLEVLYCAGALAALGSAVFLFFTGVQLTTPTAALTTAVIFLVQAFVPSLFSFPLAYSFGAVYACLSACACLWLMVKACTSTASGCIMGAGIAASVSALMKQEIGGACFVALAVLIALRGAESRSIRRLMIDLASIAPGSLLCAGVALWMISLRGPAFLTQENFMSWPTSFFMKKYGAAWLSRTGLVFSWHTFWISGVVGLAIPTVCWYIFRLVAQRYGQQPLLFWIGIVALIGMFAVALRSPSICWRFLTLFLPGAAPFLIALLVPISVWWWWRSRFNPYLLQALILFVLAASLSARILFGLQPFEYPIYYDGPVILSLFVILSWFLNGKYSRPAVANRFTELLPCLAILASVIAFLAPLYRTDLRLARLVTDRGVIYTQPEKAAAYRSVLDFLRRHAGATFMSLPEDTSLYFLTGTSAPSRVYEFTPGILVPGAMTDQVLRNIEQKKIQYLIWSNRRFAEYGVPEFGVDFDQQFAAHLKSSFRPIRTFGDDAQGDWKASIWERTQSSAIAAR